jgi:hypothetical protein
VGDLEGLGVREEGMLWGVGIGRGLGRMGVASRVECYVRLEADLSTFNIMCLYWWQIKFLSYGYSDIKKHPEIISKLE